MTTQEFSNIFDTLLNSYASQAFFGEQASQNEIVLDEYEKSVLLTQAQDIILKQYFQRTSVNEGFDDSTRRQTDFSSLITVEDCPATSNSVNKYDDRSQVFELPVNSEAEPDTTKVLLIINEKLCITESVNGGPSSVVKQCVVVPINYREYDRLMSKAFSQPLKKQAWRLTQDNNSSNADLYAEIVPTNAFSTYKSSAPSGTVRNFVYRMRYIRRPKPIILTNLAQDYQEDLDIDGYTNISECELNPILHMDIVTKAVELALSTRGIRPQPKTTKE